MTWSWLLLALLLVLVWYLTYSATRLDRLHYKLETTRAALDTQLVRRSAAAAEAAAVLDPATGLIVAAAAAEAMVEDTDVGTLRPASLVEEGQSDLTRALQVAFADPDQVAVLRRDPLTAELLSALGGACRRVQLARRFHNEAVAQAQRVRRKPVVRWARLAGHAAWPEMVEIDDVCPPGLAQPDAGSGGA